MQNPCQSMADGILTGPHIVPFVSLQSFIALPVLTTVQPTDRPTEARREGTAHQNTSSKRYDLTKLCWPHLPDPQWEDLQQRADNGGHGRAQTRRVLADEEAFLV